MTLVLIQAVPWEPRRAARAETLAEATGGTVVWDQDHDAFLTWKRVLDTAGTAPVVVMEDDVALCADWQERLDAEIAARPSAVIRGYDDWPTSDPDHETPRWCSSLRYAGNLCTYLPPYLASEHRRWLADRDTPFLRKYHDLALGQWLARRRIRYWQVTPSLVQHEAWQSSVMPRRRTDRQSPTFQGASV